MTIENLEKLKSKLPKCYAITLGKKCELSEDTVRKVLNNRHNNQNIIDEAIILAQEWQDHLKKQSQLIDAL